jgi:class 3 adenylate cyclase
MDETEDGGRADKGRGTGYRTSLATRLAVAVLVVSIVSILVAIAVSVTNIGSSAEDLIENRIDARANSLASELDVYFRESVEATRFLAGRSTTAEALAAFSEAYAELEAIDAAELDQARDNVGSFYLDEFVPALAAVRGQSVDPLSVVPRSSGAPIYLQDLYIAQNDLPPEDRQLLTDPDDESAWTEAHRVYHPDLRSRVEGAGFIDLFLIDAESRSIVYSTNKDIAFATNVVSGPHSGTAMASLARRALNEGAPGDTFAADLATYTPRLDAPSGFIASPVFEGDELVGAIVVSVDLDVVSDIMTQDWRAGRFGDTGEAYLVGNDRTMRSDSRAFLENPSDYLARIDEIGTIPSIDRQRMEALGTTVVFQPADNETVRAALDGQTGLAEVTNYLGEEVYSAYRPVAGGSFGWALMVEQQIVEAEEPLNDYVRSILTVTVVFMVALTFVTVAWASSLVAPLRRMGAALQARRLDTDDATIPVTGVTEFRELAVKLNAMVDSLTERKDRALAALRAKTAILRTLLPASAVAQVQVGERRFVETVPQATVAVVKLRGIDEMIQRSDEPVGRQLITRIVETGDQIAQRNGLERVKLTGAAYQAVCGLDTPHLDHGPRAVRFVSECILAMRRLVRDADVEITVSGAVSSGTVTAGLVGDSQLVFDLWGDPVDDADRLASGAPAGKIYVSSSTRARLPGTLRLTETKAVTGETVWVLDPADTDAEVVS